MAAELTPAPRPGGRFRRHLVRRMVSGVLVLVPFLVSLLVLRFAFGFIESLVAPVAALVIPEQVPRPVVVALSFLVLVLLVYVVGAVITVSVGRRAVGLAEGVFLHVPLLRSVYGSTKTALTNLAGTPRAAFRSVVLLEFPRKGMWTLGFVTGETRGPDGATFLKVFVPTTPNPTSGFFELVPRDEVRETGLTVEEGLQAVVSGGILFPRELGPGGSTPGASA